MMVSGDGNVMTLDLLPDARILGFTVALTACTVCSERFRRCARPGRI
jgi:hypothetical protein